MFLMANRFSSSFASFVTVLTVVTVVGLHQAEANDVPAVYVFGDSLLDVGTNNFLSDSIAKANFLYNGIDFPHSQPTGRFSNGHNTADQIVKKWVHRLSPQSYLSLLNTSDCTVFRRRILKGVNFASGGSGIFDSTGSIAAKEVVSLGKQIQQFSVVRNNITEILGQQNATVFLSQSIFLISVGSNDIFDYQLNISNPSCTTCVSGPQFVASLLTTYLHHLENLYQLGARKFAVVGIPAIGCSPFERSFNTSGGCIDAINDLARAVFAETSIILKELSLQAPGMKYSFGNAYNITYDIIDNPGAFKMKEVKAACCGNGSFPCNHSATVCDNRKEYLFWDRFHPTQAASQYAALALFGGGPRYVAPITFAQLAAN